MTLTRIIAASLLCFHLSGDLHPQPQPDHWAKARENGEQSREAFLKCWRFTQGWLQHADARSGLIPRNLTVSAFWNAKDAAADNYPFMVLSSYFTDRSLYEGRMRKMLEAEQRLTNRLGRLPDDWAFATQSFARPESKLEDLIFGAAEYAKDGLLPVTEYLGQSPWSDRLIGLLEDIWKYGAKETEAGKIPATSNEVAGDLMQSLSRMYWMTGDRRFKEWAFQLGDYFLLHHLPTDAEFLQLDDHGCEVVNGLSEVYFLATHEDSRRAGAWRPAMHRMLDRILEVGRDEDGLLFSRVNPRTGARLTEDRTDNWGYNYNAYLVVAELDGVDRYKQAVRHVLTRIIRARDYPWENNGADGLADSLEGGLNLINRLNVPEAVEWADYTAAKLLARQRDTGVIEGWHGDGNFARTVLMWALWKTQGVYAEPWRADLRLGAARGDDGSLYVSLEADWPWRGKLRFDLPRHNEQLHVPADYPRLNQFPEWFTVQEEASYQSDAGVLAGRDLRRGLPVTISRDKPWRLHLLRGSP